MQVGINVEDVKKYNASLREYKDKSVKLRTEIEINQAELERQCKELSTELGMEVTPANIQAILTERISKIQNTMQVGNEILQRIREEEARGVQQTTSQTVIPNQSLGATPDVMQAAGQTSGTVVQPAPQALGVPAEPTLPPLPGGIQVQTQDGTMSLNSLPSIFN